MSSLIVSGDVSGTVTLSAPSAAGSVTVTLPSASGTMLTSATTQAGLPANIAGNGPTFAAYQSSTQSVSTSTPTIIQLQTKEWDTATCFNNTGSTVTLNGLSVPAYSFCPNVAGYYLICCGVQLQIGYQKSVQIYINKSGSTYRYGTFAMGDPNGYGEATTSSLVYLNGTGDYVNVSVWQGSGSTLTSINNSVATWFNASLMRAA